MGALKLPRALTLDTCALIALAGRKVHMAKVVATALQQGIPVEVPACVLAEWWRGGRSQEDILRDLTVVSLTPPIAKAAGAAMAAAYRAKQARTTALTTIDATVMATASFSGKTVYTDDLDDLGLFTTYFADVELITTSGR